MRPRQAAVMTTLWQELQAEFDQLDEQFTRPSQARYTTSDCLRRLFSMFHLRRPNLYRYELDIRTDPGLRGTIQRLFGWRQIPSDTTIRRVLDRMPPEALVPCFEAVLGWVQRQKLFEDFRSPLDGGLLLAIDGTHGLSSPTIHCSSCLVKQHRPLDPDDADELPRRTYYHQPLGAALVSPRRALVLPLFPEAMAGAAADGVQDNELKAAHRWLPKFRRRHPHLQLLALGDALYFNQPFLQQLSAHNLQYMIRAKAGNRQQETVYQAASGEDWQRGVQQPDRWYRWLAQQSLKATHPEFKVNVLQECDAQGKITEWVTNRELTVAQLEPAAGEARLRWPIENGCFRTLKNLQGPHFEHNHGHGKLHLANLISCLAMLQQLVEQVSERLCQRYQAALVGSDTKVKQRRPKVHVWEVQMRVLAGYQISTWEEVYDLLARPRPAVPIPET